MAITAETRTHLIGLSVVMLGEAPGTERLGDWVGRYDDGMSLEAIANHIAGSSAFRAEYPNFDTNRDFAEKFLGNLMGGEDVSADLVSAAVDIVVGLLNDGMTRGALALAVVGAMLEINAQGAAHPAHGDLGGVAARLANQVEVAEYHTLTLRKADSSSDALAGVTSDAASVDMAKLDLDQDYDAMFDPVGELTLDEHADGSGEGNAIGVGHVTASDGDGDTVAYSIKGDPDGWAILDDGKLCYVGMGIDYEEMTSVDLTIVATSTGADGTETSVEQMVTVNIVNDPADDPADAVFDPVGELTLEENADGSGMAGDDNAPISVGHVTASDANGDEVAYSIKGDPADWAILEDGKLCYIGTGVDYETDQSVNLTIVATSIGANGEETSVEQMVTVQIGDVDDVPDEPMRFVLTPGVDAGPDFTGGDADDTFVAVPADVSGEYVDVLNAFDSLDGGAGMDTLHISGAGTQRDIVLGTEDVKNIESVVIDAVREGIDADLSEYEGLEMVNLRRFGSESDVSVTVDGATVSTDETFGGDATIVGAAGDVSIKAGGTSDVHVGSAGHTKTVSVEGGDNITIGKNANGSGQSQTVTNVHVNGVAADAVTETTTTYAPKTNVSGFVVDVAGRPVTITDPDPDATDTVVSQVGLADDGALTNAITGARIVVGYSWDHDGDGSANDVTADPSATPPVVGATAPIAVTAELKVDIDSGGLAFGKLITIAGYTLTDGVFVNDSDNTITVKPNAIDGDSVPASAAYVSNNIDKVETDSSTTTVSGTATLTINSDAIEEVNLRNTKAIAVVKNDSKTEDKKPMPENLSITVDKYGDKDTDGTLRIEGTGSAQVITLNVTGDSWVDLNSNVVKDLTINASAKLDLEVSKFNSDNKPSGASTTLESVEISGAGAVTMNSLTGMNKLESIDARDSSGNNNFKSMANLAALESVMGGTGNDTVSLVGDEDGKLESIHTGDGNDNVSVSGDYREDGLTVDLGAGNDMFSGGAGNDKSRVDGGAGTDTLKLSADGATYKEGDETMSIYSNFEILDVGGGSGEYDVGRLGVDSVTVSSNATVTLNKVGGRTPLSVEAGMAGMNTEATVTYNQPAGATTPGTILGGGSDNSQILDVNLMAMGGSGDNNTNTQSGLATLTLTVSSGVQALIVDSEAQVHRTAAGNGVKSGHYQNVVEVEAAGTPADPTSSIQEVRITGDAKTELKGAGLASLKYVDASGSGGGVTVDATADNDGTGTAVTNVVTLIGSNRKDVFMASNIADGTSMNKLSGNGGDDELTGGTGKDSLNGGAGADELRGGAATDLFVFNADSDSQVSFKEEEDGSFTAQGYDEITDFVSGTDKLHFSKELYAIVTGGEIVGTNVTISDGFKASTEWAGWHAVDTDGDPTTTGANTTTDTTSIDGTAITRGGPSDGGAGDLRDFIGDGKGLFLTSATTTGGGFGGGDVTRTFKNGIAAISDTTAGSQGLWLLIDTDKDGDFDADTDMVIFLSGTAPPTFVAADITSA